MTFEFAPAGAAPLRGSAANAILVDDRQDAVFQNGSVLAVDDTPEAERVRGADDRPVPRLVLRYLESDQQERTRLWGFMKPAEQLLAAKMCRAQSRGG